MSELETVRAVPLFEGLSDSQLDRILSASTRRQVEAGTVIVREGEASDALFVLLEGRVDVTKSLGLAAESALGAERDKTIVRLTAPQFFGEMALIGDTVRTATVIASTSCELLEFTLPEFERLVQSDLPLGYRLLHNIAVVLCARLRRTDRDVLKLTTALSLALGNR